jgi:serine/threonine protein kinase
MRSMIHTYEADNLLGLRIDDGRLELVAVLGHGAEGDVFLARNVAPSGLCGVYQKAFYVSGQSYRSEIPSPAIWYPYTDFFLLALSTVFIFMRTQAVKVISKLGLDNRSLITLQEEILLHQQACAEDHPGILTLHNVVDLTNTLYLVSAFAPCGDLFERITSPLRPRLCFQTETIRSIALQLVEAVEYLHNVKGIAHRDIKPENLFWETPMDSNGKPLITTLTNGAKLERGRLFIGDFGLATQDRQAGDFGNGTSFYTSPEASGYFKRLGLNGSGMLGGSLLSPIHLPLEADNVKSGLAIPSPAEPGKTFDFENRRSYDTFKADIWSIGIVLLNLVCERNPWTCALQADDTFRAYVEDPDYTLYQILPNLSDEFRILIKKVLAVQPRDRIDLSEMKDELLKIESFRKPATAQEMLVEQEEVLMMYEGEEDILYQDNSSWMHVTSSNSSAPRESTPLFFSSQLAAGPSQVASLGSTISGWLTMNSTSVSNSNSNNTHSDSNDRNSSNDTSNLDDKSTSPSVYSHSSTDEAEGDNRAYSSSANSNRIIEAPATNMKPKRPLPIPLQIDPYRLSVARTGRNSASIASARYAAYTRPSLAVSRPVSLSHISQTAPIIRVSATTPQQKNEKEQVDKEMIGNVIKLKMPPSPAAKRGQAKREAEQVNVTGDKEGKQDTIIIDKEGQDGTLIQEKTAMQVDPVSSPNVSRLVASVPCQLSLSSSTDSSSESGAVTPIDQMGPYIPMKGEKEGRNDQDSHDQWLTIKPAVIAEQGHSSSSSASLNSASATGGVIIGGVDGHDYASMPPITPTGQMGDNNKMQGPLTPLLLTPSSARRYHPYSGHSIIHSPMRMAQQAYLDKHVYNNNNNHNSNSSHTDSKYYLDAPPPPVLINGRYYFAAAAAASAGQGQGQGRRGSLPGHLGMRSAPGMGMGMNSARPTGGR